MHQNNSEYGHVSRSANSLYKNLLCIASVHLTVSIISIFLLTNQRWWLPVSFTGILQMKIKSKKLLWRKSNITLRKSQLWQVILLEVLVLLNKVLKSLTLISPIWTFHWTNKRLSWFFFVFFLSSEIREQTIKSFFGSFLKSWLIREIYFFEIIELFVFYNYFLNNNLRFVYIPKSLARPSWVFSVFRNLNVLK